MGIDNLDILKGILNGEIEARLAGLRGQEEVAKRESKYCRGMDDQGYGIAEGHRMRLGEEIRFLEDLRKRYLS